VLNLDRNYTSSSFTFQQRWHTISRVGIIILLGHWKRTVGDDCHPQTHRQDAERHFLNCVPPTSTARQRALATRRTQSYVCSGHHMWGWVSTVQSLSIYSNYIQIMVATIPHSSLLPKRVLAIRFGARPMVFLRALSAYSPRDQKQ
jgi:hypothetical protein